MRINVFDGRKCKCGCGAFWSSSLTLWERLMFASGFWTKFDFSNTEYINAPLGGEHNALRNSLDKISEVVEGV